MYSFRKKKKKKNQSDENLFSEQGSKGSKM